MKVTQLSQRNPPLARIFCEENAWDSWYSLWHERREQFAPRQYPVGPIIPGRTKYPRHVYKQPTACMISSPILGVERKNCKGRWKHWFPQISGWVKSENHPSPQSYPIRGLRKLLRVQLVYTEHDEILTWLHKTVYYWVSATAHFFLTIVTGSQPTLFCRPVLCISHNTGWHRHLRAVVTYWGHWEKIRVMDKRSNSIQKRFLTAKHYSLSRWLVLASHATGYWRTNSTNKWLVPAARHHSMRPQKNCELLWGRYLGKRWSRYRQISFYSERWEVDGRIHLNNFLFRFLGN